MIFRAATDPGEPQDDRRLSDRVHFFEDTDWLGVLLQVARWTAKHPKQPKFIEITVAKGDPNA